MTARKLGMLISASSMLHFASAALLVAAMWVLASGAVWPPRQELHDQIGAGAK
jgi:hypothetical protein